MREWVNRGFDITSHKDIVALYLLFGIPTVYFLYCVFNFNLQPLILSVPLIILHHMPKSVLRKWIYRWFFATNHKDIGTLYLLFGIFSGILGTTLSILIRWELAAPGNQILMGNHQTYNVLVTAHALVMIFLCVYVVLYSLYNNFFVSEMY